MRPSSWLVAGLLTALAVSPLALGSPPEDPVKDASESTPAVVVTTVDAVAAERRAAGGPYREFLRVPAMNAGLYQLAAGAEDRQSPHATDEIYHVLAGRAVFEADGQRTPVSAGALLYVRAGVEHRFVDITEDLSVLVVFAGD